MYLTAQEQEQRFKLYNQGLTDPQIAKIVFATPGAIYHWRKKNKLKANKMVKAEQKREKELMLKREKAESLRKRQHEERMRLYNQGLSDTEIAKLLNYHRDTISKWRRELGLKRNMTKRNEEQYILLYCKKGI